MLSESNSEHLKLETCNAKRLNERRFTCRRGVSAIGAETLMNHARYEEQRLTVFGGYVTVALVYGASGRNDLDIELLEIESQMEV
jgi:hypothetical protein